MKVTSTLFRDLLVDSSGPMMESKSDYWDSKKLLLDIMMKKYDISENDLHDISTVKSKLRDLNINEILK